MLFFPSFVRKTLNTRAKHFVLTMRDIHINVKGENMKKQLSVLKLFSANFVNHLFELCLVRLTGSVAGRPDSNTFLATDDLVVVSRGFRFGTTLVTLTGSALIFCKSKKLWFEDGYSRPSKLSEK